MAKEGKVKEVVYEGEENGCEQDSNNIPEGMDLHFTYCYHEMFLSISHAEKWFVETEMTIAILLSHSLSRHKLY